MATTTLTKTPEQYAKERAAWMKKALAKYKTAEFTEREDDTGLSILVSGERRWIGSWQAGRRAVTMSPREILVDDKNATIDA